MGLHWNTRVKSGGRWDLSASRCKDNHEDVRCGRALSLNTSFTEIVCDRVIYHFTVPVA